MVNEGEDTTQTSMDYTQSGNHDGNDKEKVVYSGWKAMPYIIGNETCEKLGTIGTTSNLLVYFQRIFHMRSAEATSLLNYWSGTTNLATVLGAFVCDAYLGRFRTLAIACVASAVGMAMLTMTAAVPGLHPPPCKENGPDCEAMTTGQFSFLLGALTLLVIGAGGIRPCNLAFGADQFNPVTAEGKSGVASFFNWYYVTYTAALAFSITVIIYVQSQISWTIGLGVPSAMMFVSCMLFFIGARIYVKIRPEGSPFTGIAQVFSAAIRKRKLKFPEGYPDSLFNPVIQGSKQIRLSHTSQFSCLDKAAILTMDDEIDPYTGVAANQWRLCSLQQLEQVKCMMRLLPVWSSGILYMLASVNNQNFLVLQAEQANRHLGNKFMIPPASFTMFGMAGLVLFVPFYDKVLVPKMRKRTGQPEGITLLQRLGIGIPISLIAMTVAGVVEQKRRSMVHDGSTISSMHSLWLVPQIMISGLSEAFCVIGQMEFFYKEAPENMRSVAGSFFFFGVAMANYLANFVMAIVRKTTTGVVHGYSWLPQDLNKGRLDYYYFMTACLGCVNFGYFLLCAKWYKYKIQDQESKEGDQEMNIMLDSPSPSHHQHQHHV